MTISSSLKAAVARSNELDARLARRIGRHIDVTAKNLEELKPAPEPLALPEATASDFKDLKDSDLKQLLTGYKVPGRGRKGLKKADRIALCIEHGIQPLTFGVLLNFYLQNS